MTNAHPALRAAVFDLDGTLVDSAPDIARALSTALAQHALGPIRADQVRPILGGGARILVGAALSAVDGDSALTDDVLTAYTTAYTADPVSGTTVHADARTAIRELRDAGVRIGICTNKRSDLTHRVLAGTGLADLVDAVVGIDSAPAGKPDPAHLITVLDELGVTAAETVYVGDTEVDALTARRAGATYRHVAWGATVPGCTVIEQFSSLLELTTATTTPQEETRATAH
ncbi:phosphoglycolate phosphatase [Saccharopolyspora antimicrobica]|uniref:Phosphoglycolate phosphatase n=1 Tax=Saccharopolyspora antimicrobica TaxID=455193 RepID=A0A1I5LY90_9PSEU|nr:HAD-IA family hydrolase [Saccharopolyspora antimicrobica]RKT89045.1 phosphoglycolate phosphatase [Saccharopolyspora antimicrobica]SFP01731.1 phosphoglycolate phosphatase [Saccharopolyspora antimicrobica]